MGMDTDFHDHDPEVFPVASQGNNQPKFAGSESPASSPLQGRECALDPAGLAATLLKCGCEPIDSEGMVSSRCPACRSRSHILRLDTTHGLPSVTCAAGCSGDAVIDALIALVMAHGSLPKVERLVSIGVKDFFLRPFSPREAFLDPWVHQRDVGFMYAWRGVGKTLFGLSLAAAMAAGNDFLGWKAPCPRRVVYVDGEMPYELLREHLETVIRAGRHDIENENLRLVTGDIQEDAFPNISTPDGQEALIETIGDAEFVFLDNVACLSTGNAESDPAAWEPVRQFQLRLRRSGIGNQLTHHAGKGGDQRGHSGKEDICDWVVKLEHPADYREDQGARFAVRFTKMRKNVQAVPVEAWLKIGPDGEPFWQVRPLEGFLLDKVVELTRAGRTQRQIVRDLKDEGIEKSVGTVNALLKKAKQEGKL